jgi:hypothetical protein
MRSASLERSAFSGLKSSDKIVQLHWSVPLSQGETAAINE